MAQRVRRTTRTVMALGAVPLLLVAGCGGEGSEDEPTRAVAGTLPATAEDVTTAAGPAATAAPTTAAPATSEVPTGTATAVRTRTGSVDADDPTEGAGGDAGTGPDTAEASGEPPVLVDVRVGSRDGYDRVVWEFADGGSPGWRAEYVDDPARQGSGTAVELPGDATLMVMIEGVRAPFEAPDGVEAYLSSDRVTASSASVVTEVEPGGWYEGYVDGFVGVTAEQPFRVRLFDDPTRVVLDVEH